MHCCAAAANVITSAALHKLVYHNVLLCIHSFCIIMKRVTAVPDDDFNQLPFSPQLVRIGHRHRSSEFALDHDTCCQRRDRRRLLQLHSKSTA